MRRRRKVRPLAAGLAPGLLVGVLLVPAAAVPATGQERPEVGTVFTGKTVVLAVEVPVQVLAGGEPVRGLTVDDFRIYEGEELLALTGFEVVDLSVTSPAGDAGSSEGTLGLPPGPVVPPAARRHFLLFFDVSGMKPVYVSRALHGARSLVRDHLHRSDLVGVAFYTQRHGVNLALQFTPDRGQVERVLDAFEILLEGNRDALAVRLADPEAALRERDALGLTAGGFGVALAEVGEAAGFETSEWEKAKAVAGGLGGGPGGFLMDNLLAHSAQFMEQVYVEQRSTQAAYLGDNMKALAQALRSIEGPKHLMLYSQGFGASLMEVSPGSVGVGRGGGSWLLSAMDEMIAELRSSGWVIHGADVGGIASPFESARSFDRRSGLFYLTEQTGGLLIENTNDLADGAEDVVERTGVTYVLTFQVEDVREDGAFHPIRVELVDGPRRARLVHRTGYYAPRPPGEEREPFELRAEAASRILAGESRGNRPVSVSATALRYAGERARVPVLVEIPRRELAGGRSTSEGPIELYVYAFEDSGAVAGFFAQRLAGDTGELAPHDEVRGVKVAGELELPPGRYEIRVLVRETGDEAEAVRIAELEVPTLGGGARLLPPLFVQAGGERWSVLGVGDEDGDDAGGSYPFVVEGRRIAPAAAPILTAGQTPRLLVPGVGLSGADMQLETRIVTDAGAVVRTEPLRILGRRSSEPGQPDLLVAELQTSGLDPGSYRVELALPGTSHRVSAPFRVIE